MRPRLLPCPHCMKPSLYLVPDLSKRPTHEGSIVEEEWEAWLVHSQMCSCKPVYSVLTRETDDGVEEEAIFTPAVEIIPSQPGSLGVDGRRF